MKRIEYRKLPKYKYRLEAEYHHQTNINTNAYVHRMKGNIWLISLSPSGALACKEGYAWDGASGPTIDTKSTIRASLVHDALYQLISTGKLPKSARRAADRLLYNIMIEDGSSRFRASYYYRAVRMFGASHTRKKLKKIEKLYAP